MTVHAPYDTLVGTKRMMASGVDQKTSEATVTEITIATNGLVSKEDLHRELQLQNEKIGNKIHGETIIPLITTSVTGKTFYFN